MKKKLRFLAEKLANVTLVRLLFKIPTDLLNFFSRLWGFFYIRAIIPLPEGSDCHWSVQFKYPENIHLLGKVMISPNCVIGAKAPVSFGSDVRLSQGVHIETASLDLNGDLPYKHVAKPVKIGSGVWLGAHSIVLGGVEIGENAVIGAGVIVSKSVKAGAIIVGSKVREIEKRIDYTK